MAEPLTPKQRALLKFILRRITVDSWAPSMREMCEAFGWASVHTAHCHLVQLQRKGLVERLPGQARALRITPEGLGALS